MTNGKKKADLQKELEAKRAEIAKKRKKLEDLAKQLAEQA